MQFFTIATVLASAVVALALPGGPGNPGGDGGNHPLCPVGLYANAECCATDVLGVADLDCSPREFLLRLRI